MGDGELEIIIHRYLRILDSFFVFRLFLFLHYLQNGLMNGMPFLSSYFASVIFCYVADYLIIHKVITLTNVRKVFTALCKFYDFLRVPNLCAHGKIFTLFNVRAFFAAQVVPGFLILLITYFDCDTMSILITWFTAVTLITAAYAGAMANIVDIAPNFAGKKQRHSNCNN